MRKFYRYPSGDLLEDTVREIYQYEINRGIGMQRKASTFIAFSGAALFFIAGCVINLHVNSFLYLLFSILTFFSLIVAIHYFLDVIDIRFSYRITLDLFSNKNLDGNLALSKNNVQQNLITLYRTASTEFVKSNDNMV
jgi:hypothetical protein